MQVDIEGLLRNNIRKLKPYASARDEFSGNAEIFLDANENAFGSVALEEAFHRYPDPYQEKLKEKIAGIEQVTKEEIFLGNGSDEAIDLLIRAFCNPGTDNILILPPTYGMYKVSADINDVEALEAPLLDNFQPDVEGVFRKINLNTKIIFICSPNNPSGNLMTKDKVLEIVSRFKGIVALDEAYIDFCKDHSLLSEIKNYNNLVVFRTLSKAWGLAALRMGMAFANPQIIQIYNKIKAPYNINLNTQELAFQALSKGLEIKKEWVRKLIELRKKLAQNLQTLPKVVRIYPSDANFLLVKVKKANEVYRYLMEKGIIVRNRSNVILCDDCLRITVGTEAENHALIEAMKMLNEC